MRDEDEGTLTIVMPLYTRSLREALDGGELTDTHKLKIAYNAASGLRYLHSRNPPILHRDMKSYNIMLDKAGDAVIVDFGLSKVKQSSMSRSTGVVVGTYCWMAPEIMDAKPYTAAADIYSFGVEIGRAHV